MLSASLFSFLLYLTILKIIHLIQFLDLKVGLENYLWIFSKTFFKHGILNWKNSILTICFNNDYADSNPFKKWYLIQLQSQKILRIMNVYKISVQSQSK